MTPARFFHHRQPGPWQSCDGENWSHYAREKVPRKVRDPETGELHSELRLAPTRELAEPILVRCTRRLRSYLVCVCGLRFCSESCWGTHEAENGDAELVPRWQVGERAIRRRGQDQGVVVRVSADGYGLVVALDAGGRVFEFEEDWRKPVTAGVQGRIEWREERAA